MFFFFLQKYAQKPQEIPQRFFPTVKKANEYSVDRLKVLDSVHTVDSGALLLLLLRTLQLRRRGVIQRFSPLSIESTTENRYHKYHDINTVILTAILLI